MLVDAIRAESFRLARSRTTWFWSVFFVPIMAVLFGVVSSLVVNANATKLAGDTKAPPELLGMLAGGPLNLGEALVSAAGGLAGPATLLFVLIGAATLYAGDYRWETWRLISARNARHDLLLGKLGVVAGLALVAMAAMLVATLIENSVRAAVFHRPLTFSMDGEAVGRFFAYTSLSWLRIVQFTMMAMLAAFVTRSLLAALFVPLVLGVVQFFTPQILMPMGFTPDSWLAVLVNPAAATDTVKALIEGGPAAAELTPGLPLKAWICLALWTLLPLAGALAWFRRQDLSKE
jgi:ABC-2 type transport system permease protein